jgi:hypothetical protein
MTPEHLPTVNMLWIGSRLGPVERASMASFMRHGHPVILHVYSSVSGVPDGVTLRDAAAIVRWDQMEALRYPNGSYSVASDLFRLKLMHVGAGLWSDCDMLCLHPIKLSGKGLMGLQYSGSANTAILWLPISSPITAEIMQAFRPNRIPPWAPWYQTYPRALARLLSLRGFGPQHFRWGTYGPRALSALLTKHDLMDLPEPVDVFYPLRSRQWSYVWEPGSSFEKFVTARTKTIHLWHANHPDGAPPATSALGQFIRELGV